MTDTEQALYDLLRAVVREELAKQAGADSTEQWLEVMRQFAKLRKLTGDDWQ